MRRGSKADEIMTLVFMLLALATVVCFCISSVDRSITLTLGGIAVLIRLIQYVLRYFN